MHQLSKRVLHITALLLLSINATAADDLSFACTGANAPKSSFYPEIHKAATNINAKVCEIVSSPVPPGERELTAPTEMLQNFGHLVAKKIKEDFSSSPFINMSIQADYFETIMADRDKNTYAIPAFQSSDLSEIGNKKEKFFFPAKQTNGVVINSGNKTACQSIRNLNADCFTLLNDLAVSINPYQDNMNRYTAYKTSEGLTLLSSQWDNYLDKARYQNILGIMLTTVMERKHFKQDHLVGPPKRQYFALQPTLVYENINAAPDGAQQDLAVAMEWLGVNWWNDSVIGIPFGVSLTSTYADRPEVDDVGHGLMFHFDNVYSIGVAYHGEDTGVYLTFDALKWLSDKKDRLASYRSQARDLFK